MESRRMNFKTITGKQLKELRLRLGLDQFHFWTPLGLTQSGGSRYESGRRIGPPMRLLLELAHGKDPQKLLKRIRTLNGSKKA